MILEKWLRWLCTCTTVLKAFRDHHQVWQQKLIDPSGHMMCVLSGLMGTWIYSGSKQLWRCSHLERNRPEWRCWCLADLERSSAEMKQTLAIWGIWGTPGNGSVLSEHHRLVRFGCCVLLDFRLFWFISYFWATQDLVASCTSGQTCNMLVVWELNQPHLARGLSVEVAYTVYMHIWCIQQMASCRRDCISEV